MLTRFVREHVAPVAIGVFGVTAFGLGLISDVYQLWAAGIPWPMWAIGGALAFATSIVWLIYRLFVLVGDRSNVQITAAHGEGSPLIESQAENLIRPDVSLFEVIHWKIKGYWLSPGESRFVLPREEYSACIGEISDRGRTGELTFWGRPRQRGNSKAESKFLPKPKPEKISPDYLKFSELLIWSRIDSRTRSSYLAELSPESYTELMASSHEVMALWPRRVVGAPKAENKA